MKKNHINAENNFNSLLVPFVNIFPNLETKLFTVNLFQALRLFMMSLNMPKKITF